MITTYQSTTYIRFTGDRVKRQYRAYLSQTVLHSDTGFAGNLSTTMLFLYAALLSLRDENPEPLKYMYHEGKVVPWATLAQVQAQRRQRRTSYRATVQLSGSGTAAICPTYSTAGRTKRQSSSSGSIVYNSRGDLTIDLGGTLLTLLDAVGHGVNRVVFSGRSVYVWVGHVHKISRAGG